MQLNDLKTHPVIKFFAYAGFALIIISFVFFYGWNTQSQQAMYEAQALARVRSDHPLSFLPWRKWEPVMPEEVRQARALVVNRKLALMDPVSQMLLIQEARRQGIDLNRLLVSDEEAVLQAIDTRILRRKAEELGIRVSTEEIREQLRAQPGMTPDLLRQLAQGAGLSVEGFIERMRRQQEAIYARQFIADEARVSTYEMWLEYLLGNEEMRLALLPFPAAEFTEEVQVADAELQQYLAENAEDFRVPAQRRYAYVKADLEEIRRNIQPTDEELREFMEANAEDFATGAAAYAEDIYVPILDDQPTTQAQTIIQEAQQMLQASPDRPWSEIQDELRARYPEARIYYRDVGPVQDDQLHVDIHGPEFIEAVFNLGDGEISPIVQSRTGLNIIRRRETTPGQLPELSEVRDEVRRRYIEDRAREIFDERRALMRGEVEEYATLAAFAEETDFEVRQTSWVDADATVIPGVGDLSQHAAYVRNLRPNQVSEMIPTESLAVALQVVESRESYIPELAEIRTRLETVVRRRKAIDLAREAAQQALARAREGATLETLAEDAPTTLTTTELVTRTDLLGSRGIDVADQPLIGFDRETIEVTEGSVGLSAFGEDPANPAGYALWRVVELEPPTREEFARDRAIFEQSYRQMEQMIVVEEWLSDQRRELDYELLNVAFE